MKFATKAVHAGQEPDSETGAIMPPLFLTSTFIQETPGEGNRYEYTRAGNPNFTRFEILLAALEEGKYATVFSSGLAGVTALLSTLRQGDRVIVVDGLYGGTYRLFFQVFAKFGIKFERVGLNEMHRLKDVLKTKPQWLYFETPTNPLLEILDIESLAAAAKRNGVKTMVDNTFASPYFQNPLLLGADAVLHSTTKYIGGHSDIIGGVVITNDAGFKEELDFARKALGLNPSPFDVWLGARGCKTLAVRMEQHQINAIALANFLLQHPLVKKVYYPGLEIHSGHEIARRQMRGYSGVVSAEFNLSLAETKQLITSFSVFSLAESLGGVESLVSHPATMTHASIQKKDREAMGLVDGLVRFSVGIEDSQDILQDVEERLGKVYTNSRK